MVAGGLAVLFTPEVALQQGEGCSFALARWLETVHNCTIGLTGVYSCGKRTGAKAWKSPCVNVGLFPTPRGIGFLLDFYLIIYLIDSSMGNFFLLDGGSFGLRCRLSWGLRKDSLSLTRTWSV